ncbi:hypothetical protein F5X96DRAFT_674612 [Biscogniauxia mediterranea]|nr:hypothetical protein F5X96DRAFT_674612 [Biscogniauxia mediterranea]
MCLFPYPAHPPKSKKGKKMKKLADREYIQETTRKVIDEAIGQTFSEGSYYATAPVRMLSRNRIGCEMDYWPEEYRHAHVTQGQWNEHKETLKKTYDMVGDDGKKMDSLRVTMVGEGEVTRDAIKETYNSVKDTQGAVGDAQDAIKSTRDAIESAHTDIKNSKDAITSTRDAVRDAQEMIMKTHGEQISKQADCAAEVDKVRKFLEEDARKRDEAEKRQQTMQEAWNYAQWLRQADWNAIPFSRSSSRSTSSRRSESRRRRKTSEEPREPGRRRQRERERESKDSLVERLEKVLSSTEKANKNREEDNRHCGYGPGYWGDNCRDAWHYPPSQNYFYDDYDTCGDTRGYVPPYRRPFRPGTTGGGPSWEQRGWHR